MVKKIVFIGPAAAGKTTTRRFLFEGTRARDLLDNPEPASIGLKFTRYDYMLSAPAASEGDRELHPEKILVDLALVDTAGQEMDRWVIESKERVFSQADLVFFFFDVSAWEDPAHKMYVMDFISFADDARIELAPDSSFHVIAHKCDTVISSVDEVNGLEHRIRTGLRDYLFQKKQLFLDHNVHATSIVKPFRDMTHSLFVDLLTDGYVEIM